MTSRRGFLGALGAAIAGATLDPERLLWRPGARVISVPRPLVPDFDAYVRPAALSLADALDRSMLVAWQRHVYAVMQNPLQVAMAVRGEFGYYSKSAAPLKVGDAIALRRPVRFIGDARPPWVGLRAR